MNSGRFVVVQELGFETAKLSDMGCATLLGFDLMMLRYRVFRVRKFRIWEAMRSISYFSENAFSSCEKFKYEQCHPASTSICWCLGIAFSRCETFKYVQCFPAIRFICWFSGIVFSGVKRCDKGSAIMQGGRLADAQESLIHFAKGLDMCSVDMKVLRFADDQESRFLLGNFHIYLVPP